MTKDDKRLRWFALAGSAFIATIFVPMILMPDTWHLRYPDPTDDPLWGVLMGVTCYALINAVSLRTQKDKDAVAAQNPHIGRFAVLTPLLGGVAVVWLAGQNGMIPNWPAIIEFNVAQIATTYLTALWWLERQDEA